MNKSTYDCCYSRGIGVFCVVGKICEEVLIKRIEDITDGAIGKQQSHVWKDEGCVDHLQWVRCREVIRELEDVYRALIYLEKAFDRR